MVVGADLCVRPATRPTPIDVANTGSITTVVVGDRADTQVRPYLPNGVDIIVGSTGPSS